MYMILMIWERHIVQFSFKWTLNILLIIILWIPALSAQLHPSFLPVADITTLKQQEKKISGVVWRHDDLPKTRSLDDLWIEISGSFTMQEQTNNEKKDRYENAFVFTPVLRDENGTILLTKENYHNTITELYLHPEVYVWENISLFWVVFIWRDDLPNEFWVWLYYMTCCAADAQLLGLRFQTSGVVPHVWKWVEVTWEIAVDKISWHPLIILEELVPISPLEDPYMYY